jgi:ubiquinone/menaquinone biosynthesis C-methylase UbiE
MLQAAREKLGAVPSEPGENGSVQLIQADLASAAWLAHLDRGQRFDLIVSRFSIHHLADERKRALYAEIYELLVPGGVFMNLEHVSSPTPAVEALFNDYFIDHLYAFHRQSDGRRSRKEVAETYYSRPDKVENILVPTELQCDWLREIGFQDVDCFFKAFELALFGGRKLDL